MAIDPIPTPRSPLRPGSSIDPASIRKSLDIDDKRARAEAVASQLESVFMGMMVKAMRATVPEDSGIGGRGLGGSNYIEMLDQHYSQMAGIPRDSRFHESLVRQIMSTPDESAAALDKMHTAESGMRKTTAVDRPLKI